MKILVIGGAGYVGSNLLKELNKNKNYKLTSLDNYYTGTNTNHIEGVNYIYGNSWEINELEKHDIVFHFGEYSRVVPSFQDIIYLFKSNLYGTSKVIEQCKKWNAKLIYSASSSKFGNNENLSPYSWVKSKIVELIKNYSEWFGLKYEICYFYNVYGKNHINNGNYATVIGIFEKQYSEKKPLTVVYDGKQTRQFTHIDDIISALLLIINQNKNHEWYLTAEKNYKIIDVARMFSKDIVMIPKKRGERYCVYEIPNDTKKILNWETNHTLENYIENFKNGEG